MNSLHTGVTFYEDDRGYGPFMIRIGGTSDFVSEIDPHYERCSPPGKVETTPGWRNPSALRFNTMDEASCGCRSSMGNRWNSHLN